MDTRSELMSEHECVYTDLLQTEDEGLGTLNLVDLPSLTHSLLDDVAVIIVILQRNKTLLAHEELSVLVR